VEELKNMDYKTIFNANTKSTAREFSTSKIESLYPPFVDGKILPKHPLEAVAEGSAKDIELLIGTNSDEMKLYSALEENLRELDDKGLQNLIKIIMDTFGKNGKSAEKLIKTYKEARKGKYSNKPDELFAAIATDFVFRIPAIRLAEIYRKHQKKIYNYLFTWPSPALNGKFGSCHAVEIAFVFGTIDLPKMDVFVGKGPDANTLSERMMDSWISFAKSGDPNHKNIPKWHVYDEDKRATMIMNKEFKVVNAYLDKERSAWDEIL